MNSVIDKKGRAWIPEELLRAAGIDGSFEMTVEFDSTNGTLVIRPGEQVPEEDWDCYLPSAWAAVERARLDEFAGRVYNIGRAELERLGEDPTFLEEIRRNPKYRATTEAAGVRGA